MRAHILRLAAICAVGACHYQPAAVPLQGTRSDLASLAGQWVGDYSSDQTGRNGSILFRLAAGQDSAYGDVLMIDALPQRGGATASAESEMVKGTSQLLRIAFVHVSGRRVSGAMESYVDPACDCKVRTTFVGTVGTNVVEGTFVTRGVNGGLERTGHWRVQRRTRP